MSEFKTYNIGDKTMAKVFKPFNLTNVYDMQSVFDAVEAALTAPDVSELVRYRGSDIHYYLYKTMHPKPDPNGEYVRHDQAVAVIAAKDAEIEALAQDSDGRASIAYSAGYYQAECNLPEHEREVDALAEYRAMKAKLTQIEKQDAVGEVVSAHGDPEAFGEREFRLLVDIQKMPYGTKFYTAPVASDADLRADLMAMHKAEHSKLGEMLLDKSPDGVAASNWQGGKVNGIAAAIAALTPSEPRT